MINAETRGGGSEEFPVDGLTHQVRICSHLHPELQGERSYQERKPSCRIELLIIYLTANRLFSTTSSMMKRMITLALVISTGLLVMQREKEKLNMVRLETVESSRSERKEPRSVSFQLDSRRIFGHFGA